MAAFSIRRDGEDVARIARTLARNSTGRRYRRNIFSAFPRVGRGGREGIRAQDRRIEGGFCLGGLGRRTPGKMDRRKHWSPPTRSFFRGGRCIRAPCRRARLRSRLDAASRDHLGLPSVAGAAALVEAVCTIQYPLCLVYLARCPARHAGRQTLRARPAEHRFSRIARRPRALFRIRSRGAGTGQTPRCPGTRCHRVQSPAALRSAAARVGRNEDHRSAHHPDEKSRYHRAHDTLHVRRDAPTIRHHLPLRGGQRHSRAPGPRGRHEGRHQCRWSGLPPQKVARLRPIMVAEKRTLGHRLGRLCHCRQFDHRRPLRTELRRAARTFVLRIDRPRRAGDVRGVGAVEPQAERIFSLRIASYPGKRSLASA